MDRPFVVCHMFASLDGKIDGDFFAAPEAKPALEEYGKLRGFYGCQATLYGTTTMAGGYSDGFAPAQPECGGLPREDWTAEHDTDNYIVSVDPKGVLGWKSGYIEKKGRPRAHVIEVLTPQTSPAYLSYLRKNRVSYLFAGEEALDCGQVLRKLKSRFSISRLMIAGGGTVNWSFLREGLIDELSLVVAPVADGSPRQFPSSSRRIFCPQENRRPFPSRLRTGLRGTGCGCGIPGEAVPGGKRGAEAICCGPCSFYNRKERLWYEIFRKKVAGAAAGGRGCRRVQRLRSV